MDPIGMAEGTLLTHINRVRGNRPELYAEIGVVRKAQLAVATKGLYRTPSSTVGASSDD